MKNKLNAWDVLYIKWLLNLLYWFLKNDFILNWASFFLVVSEQAVSEIKMAPAVVGRLPIIRKIIRFKNIFSLVFLV